ncbi:MAG TPA: hypothetical protein VF158_15875 [Longimicrobiales bacterium]
MAIQSIAEIEAMLQVTGGVPVTLDGGSWKGAEPTYGHLDRTAVELDGGRGYGTRIVLTIPTGALPGLALDKTPVVDGVTYRARDIVPIEDGALTQVLLAEMPA